MKVRDLAVYIAVGLLVFSMFVSVASVAHAQEATSTPTSTPTTTDEASDGTNTGTPTGDGGGLPPSGDADGDGTINEVDQCPETEGKHANDGCPISSQLVEVLISGSGTSVLNAQSTESTEETYTVINQYPDGTQMLSKQFYDNETATLTIRNPTDSAKTVKLVDSMYKSGQDAILPTTAVELRPNSVVKIRVSASKGGVLGTKQIISYTDSEGHTARVVPKETPFFQGSSKWSYVWGASAFAALATVCSFIGLVWKRRRAAKRMVVDVFNNFSI